MQTNSVEAEKWREVKAFIGSDQLTLGPHYTYVVKNNLRHLLFSLSRYKFASKMMGSREAVLDVGCSEGLLTMMLTDCARRVVGVDFDQDAISHAQATLGSERVEFICEDIMQKSIGTFGGIVAFDVIEHIEQKNENAFIRSLADNLEQDGLCMVGTPNITANEYASATSRIGHINLYSWERLRDLMQSHFTNVFMFSVNDEVVHTGFYPMAHYLIAAGTGKKTG